MNTYNLLESSAPTSYKVKSRAHTHAHEGGDEEERDVPAEGVEEHVAELDVQVNSERPEDPFGIAKTVPMPKSMTSEIPLHQR